MFPADIGSNCEASCVVSCPPGWERKGGRCYLWSDDSKNWLEAEKTCKKSGGHLASVTDQNIHDYMLGRTGKTWIGGFRNKERSWAWSDCSDWTFDSGWRPGEPNFLDFIDVEKCVEYLSIWSNGNGWNNDHCHNIKHFVCSKRICSGIK